MARWYPLAAVAALVVLAPSAVPAAAQDATHMTACTTKAECDLRADERDTEARHAEWNSSIKREQDYSVQRQQLKAQARNQSEAGKLARIREVMRRRAATAPNGN